jgi:Helix-turn-helix.
MKINEWIAANGVTQHFICAKTGLSESRLSRLVNGDMSPKPTEIALIHSLTGGEVTILDWAEHDEKVGMWVALCKTALRVK